MKTRWQRLLTDGLMVAGIGLVSAGLVGVITTHAGNAGDIKIHSDSVCATEANEPKPGVDFYVGGTNFEDGVQRWLYVTNGTNASAPVVIGPVAVGDDSSFCVGVYTLPLGHYKAYVGEVSTGPTNDMKTKVFKTEGTPDTTAPETTAAETTAPQTTSAPSTSGVAGSEETTSSVGSETPLPDTGGGSLAGTLIGMGGVLTLLGASLRLMARRPV